MRSHRYDVVTESVPVALASLAKELEAQEKAGLLQYGVSAAQATELVSAAPTLSELLKVSLDSTSIFATLTALYAGRHLRAGVRAGEPRPKEEGVVRD